MTRFVYLLFCIVFWQAAYAQPGRELYYLCFGSGHYEQHPKKFNEKGFVPYDDLEEAINSATVVSTLLSKYGAAKGKTVLSTADNFLTKSKVLSEVDKMIVRVNEHKERNPLLIVYYCGHGISENLAWNQFLIPGNYTYIPGTKNFDHLSEQLVWLGDITDKLDKAGVHYILLADCCRKQQAENSLPVKQLQYFFSEHNVETFKTLVFALKYLNEYHQADPVVFSIVPGKSAPVVAMPYKDSLNYTGIDTAIDIGPLCRRLTMTVFASSTPLSKQELIRKLTDPGLDEVSSIPVSYYDPADDPLKDRLLFRK